MPDEIRIKITADADDALKGLHDVTKAESELARETEQAGRKADTASVKDRERTRQTDQLAGSLDNAAREQRDVNEAADDYGRKAESASGKTGLFERALGVAKSTMLGFVGGLAGSQGLNAALSLYSDHLDAVNERLKKHAELTREAADAALELQFLNLVPDPTERAFAEEQAILAGRNPIEGVRAFGSLRSKNPNADPEQLKQLLTLAALKAQQTTAPLEDIAGGLSLLNKFANDPIASSNILEQAITEAGELDVANFIPLLAKFLPKGVNISGLSVGEAAGYVSGITALGLPREEAVTSLGNIALAISGKGTPEGTKILKREGIDRSNFNVALQQISQAYAEGRIAPEELQLIGGDSALTGLASISDPRILADLQASVQRVNAAGAQDSLIVSQKAAAHFKPGELQAFNLQLKQSEAMLLRQQQNDTRAIQIATARAIIQQRLEQSVTEGELIPLDVEKKLRFYDDEIARGKDPITAANNAELIGQAFIGAGSETSYQLGFTKQQIGPELGDLVQQRLDAGPSISPPGQQSTIINNNYGTMIHQGRDWRDADLLDGRPRR